MDASTKQTRLDGSFVGSSSTCRAVVIRVRSPRRATEVGDPGSTSQRDRSAALPPHDVLRRLADRHPPPQAWYDEDWDRPA